MEKFYQKTWFIVLALIVFAPVGVVLMWMYRKSWNTVVKAVASVVMLVIFMAAVIGGGSDTADASPTNTVSMTESTITAEATTAATTTAPTTTAPTTTETTLSIEEQKSKFESIDYKKIAREPDKYVDAKIKFTGEVAQVMEDTFTVLRVAESGDYDKIWYVEYLRPDGAPRILEDDTITVYGICTGLISYESTMGGKISIPGALSAMIDIAEE